MKNQFSEIPEKYKIASVFNQDTYLVSGELKKWSGDTEKVYSTISSTPEYKPTYAAKFIQYGWETITEALKHGGITNMMDRLSNPAKIKAFQLSEELKEIMQPLFEKHMDDIMSGYFSKTMMEDWDSNDENLLKWRAATGETAFEKTTATSDTISEQEYFVIEASGLRDDIDNMYEKLKPYGLLQFVRSGRIAITRPKMAISELLEKIN